MYHLLTPTMTTSVPKTMLETDPNVASAKAVETKMMENFIHSLLKVASAKVSRSQGTNCNLNVPPEPSI